MKHYIACVTLHILAHKLLGRPELMQFLHADIEEECNQVPNAMQRKTVLDKMRKSSS